ncbi:unnamed protein product [Adineta ricciae]|uniref:G-protein coupled receptors family 1 profile domain-containing protein n=1 Tax=Adineta ricciae TaxID=249248 RepID=A0A815P7M5_ADIRI|nr:unnamed protein product [Adineta ricciae]CAF1445416.1 unnamed protein product [Adineta ricciae]
MSTITIVGILYAVLASITILFSLTVLLVITTHWRLECRSTANLLTCNSCSALFLYSLALALQVPFVLQNNPGDASFLLCKIRSFIYTCSTFIVSYSFLNMAVSCYFITMLSKLRYLLSFQTHWFIIIISWVLSAIVAIATFLCPYAYVYEVESGLCVLTTKHFLAAFIAAIVVFIIPLNAIILLYGAIVFHIVQQKRIRTNNLSTSRAKRNIKVFKKIFLYTGILVIGGTPYFFSTIFHQMGYYSPALILVVHLSIASGCALDSIAILLTNKQVKNILLVKAGRRQMDPAINIHQRTFINYNQIQTITVLPKVD